MPEFDILHRFWNDLMSRPNGPYGFRFILQPIMAMILASIDGIKDARTGRSPYFWTILHHPEKRRARLHEGIKATTRVIVLGLVMEVLYQIKELNAFYPGEAIAIIIVLAFLPYLLLRGPVARIARRCIEHKKKKQER